MRELDRIVLQGPGRLGSALHAALRAGGVDVDAPLRRGEVPPADASLVLLCVPDDAIAGVAATIPPGPVVGHVSGATRLEPLHAAGHARVLSLHPLMTVPSGAGADALRDAPAAVAGSDADALAAARALAQAAGMIPFEVDDADRVAYHAAACVASNFLVTLESAAERLGATAGVARERLAPLVRATLANWLTTGVDALTGPVARGDVTTVAAHRAVIGERAPDLLPLFDALVAATRDVAATRSRPRDRARPRDLEASNGRDHHHPTPSGPGGVEVLRTVVDVRARAAGWRAAGETIALVPTMGALHAGHAALIERAAAIADRVVVWIFVNPKQFTEQSDLLAYPRDEAADVATTAAAGADVVFAPAPEEVYPPGFSTVVSVAGPSAGLEGAHRPGHFDGVATVVLKMLLMTGPDVAVFGAKDAQQVAVVRRLIRDLDVPVALDVVPTVREAGGLARSSRNVHLSPADRSTALALHRGLDAARAAHAAGERDAATLAAATGGVLATAGITPDYVAVVDPDTFLPVETVNGRALIALAARVGDTRLIDNLPLEA